MGEPLADGGATQAPPPPPPSSTVADAHNLSRSQLFPFHSSPSDSVQEPEITSFDKSVLIEANFDVHEFVAECRQRGLALHTLRSELAALLRYFRHEVVELINHEYTEFITVITRLGGVDKLIDVTRRRLRSLKTDMDTLGTALHGDVRRLEQKVQSFESVVERKRNLIAVLEFQELFQMLVELATETSGFRLLLPTPTAPQHPQSNPPPSTNISPSSTPIFASVRSPLHHHRQNSGSPFGLDSSTNQFPALDDSGGSSLTSAGSASAAGSAAVDLYRPVALQRIATLLIHLRHLLTVLRRSGGDHSIGGGGVGGGADLASFFLDAGDEGNRGVGHSGPTGGNLGAGGSSTPTSLSQAEQRVTQYEREFLDVLGALFRHALARLSTTVASADGAQQSTQLTTINASGSTALTGSRSTVLDCLRLFALMGRLSDAERVVREVFVRPKLQELIVRDLAQLQSAAVSARSTAASSSNSGQDGSPASVESARVLSEHFDRILALLQSEACRFLIDVTDAECGDVSLSMSAAISAGESTTGFDPSASANYSAASSTAAGSSSSRFDFWGSVFISEFHDRVTEQWAHIFLPSLPDVLMAHHQAFLRFLQQVESRVCPSLGAVQKLRNHDAYRRLMKRWNLNVYVQMRKKEFITEIDDPLTLLLLEDGIIPCNWPTSVLSSTSLTSSASSANFAAAAATGPSGSSASEGAAAAAAALSNTLSAAFATDPNFARETPKFLFRATHVVWRTLDSGWSREKVVPTISSDMLKITLQVWLRYIQWATAFTGRTEGNQLQTIVRRGSVTPEMALFALFMDASNLLHWITTNLSDRIRTLLESYDSTPLKFLEALFPLCAKPHADLRGGLDTDLTQLIAAQCSEKLTAMRGITTTYRMTNKGMPTEHSYYVPQILDPLRSFRTQVLDTVKHGYASSDPNGDDSSAHSSSVVSRALNDLVRSIVSEVTHRYLEMAADLLVTVRKNEDSLKRLKAATRKTTPGRSDLEKIERQIELDVKQFVNVQIPSVGLTMADVPDAAALSTVVEKPQ